MSQDTCSCMCVLGNACMLLKKQLLAYLRLVETLVECEVIFVTLNFMVLTQNYSCITLLQVTALCVKVAYLRLIETLVECEVMFVTSNYMVLTQNYSFITLSQVTSPPLLPLCPFLCVKVNISVYLDLAKKKSEELLCNFISQTSNKSKASPLPLLSLSVTLMGAFIFFLFKVFVLNITSNTISFIFQFCRGQ